MDYDFVTTRIATGAAIKGPQDVEVLVNAGITHVIDCTSDSYETTLAFAQHPALSCLWNPTPDDGAYKGPDWFRPSIEFGMMAMGMTETKLYAHCHGGKNRGPSTAFCLMLVMGWAYDAAVSTIHTARPITRGHLRYAADAANALRILGYLT